jgi:Tfp pilus assembly protein FimT
MAVHRALKRNAGVSLVELVVTVAILIVLFSLAVPAVQNDDRAGNITRSIVADASRNRSYAKRAWENVTMQIDVANNRWRSQLQDGTALQTYKSDVDGWIELPPGVTFANIGGGNTVFLPTGRTSSDAAFAIVQGSNQWHIVIKSLSGLITAIPQ